MWIEKSKIIITIEIHLYSNSQPFNPTGVTYSRDNRESFRVERKVRERKREKKILDKGKKVPRRGGEKGIRSKV